jgi:putative ABC transport system ATP-binding protein
MPKSSNKTVPNSLIEIKDLHLTLGSQAGEVNILRGINLKINHGEKVSIVGPSGSGKTSMLMVIAGLEPATSGEIITANANLGTLSEDDLARLRRDKIGIVFQGFHLILSMSALENVAIPLELAGQKKCIELATDMLALVGLEHRLHHYPAQLSGGEQQRVALARAFVGNPDLILADEPTGNLDAETGQAVIDLMFRLSDEKGTSLMLITHDHGLASKCERILEMRDGILNEQVTSS